MDDPQESLSRREQLLLALDNEEYRRGFVEGHAKDTIAFQLRSLRKARGWEQRDVAAKLGNASLQPMISRYENPDYGRYSVSTLLDLAAAFDVALIVRFAPFSELLEWDWGSTPQTLCPVSYSDDEKLTEVGAALRSERRGPQRTRKGRSRLGRHRVQGGSAYIAKKRAAVRLSSQAAVQGAQLGFEFDVLRRGDRVIEFAHFLQNQTLRRENIYGTEEATQKPGLVAFR